MTLGKYGQITAEEARKQAKNVLGQIAKGDNPIAEKKANRIKSLDAYKIYRTIILKPEKILNPLL